MHNNTDSPFEKLKQIDDLVEMNEVRIEHLLMHEDQEIHPLLPEYEAQGYSKKDFRDEGV